MNFCPKCGNVLEENCKFCRVCGAAVAAETAPVEANCETPLLVNETPAAPAYEAPAYQAPVYEAPAAPAYEAPAYQAPAYEAPAAPAYEAPAYQAPAYEAPAAPAYEAPAYQAPAAPVYEAPAAPTYEAPTYQPPVYQAPEAPAYQAPTYQPPVYNLNQQTYAPKEVAGGTKVKGFVGMGLAIGGLFFGVLACIYFVYGFIGIPLSIVGRILAGKSIEEGNTSNACSVGQKLGLAGLIVSCVGTFINFIIMMALMG